MVLEELGPSWFKIMYRVAVLRWVRGTEGRGVSAKKSTIYGSPL